MDAQIMKVPLSKVLDPDQETIVNIHGEIHEPVLTLGHVTELKEKVGLQNSLDPKKVQVFVKSFTIDPTFTFPEFIY